MHFRGSPDTIPHPPPRTASRTPSVAPPSPPCSRETAPRSPSDHTSPSYSTPAAAWEPAPCPLHRSAKPRATKSLPRKGASFPCEQTYQNHSMASGSNPTPAVDRKRLLPTRCAREGPGLHRTPRMQLDLLRTKRSFQEYEPLPAIQNRIRLAVALAASLLSISAN